MTELAGPMSAAKFALRSIAQRIETLDREIAALDAHLERLVATAAPRTVQLLGISTGHAGQMLITAGQNIKRFHGEASFAAICGASPVPPPLARPPDTASTPAATAKPTERFTSSRSVACATASAPAPTLSAALAKANPSARSCAASSATSPASSTTPSAPISPSSSYGRPNQPLPRFSAAAPASG